MSNGTKIRHVPRLDVRRRSESLDEHNERGIVAEDLNVVAVLLKLKRAECDLWAKITFSGQAVCDGEGSP